MPTLKGSLRDFRSYNERPLSGLKIADAVPLSIKDHYQASPSYLARDRDGNHLLLHKGDQVRAYFRRPNDGELYFHEGTLAAVEKHTVKLRRHRKNGEGVPNETQFFLVRLMHPDLVWWELIVSGAAKNTHKKKNYYRRARRTMR